jgi:type II secretory pathway component PulF
MVLTPNKSTKLVGAIGAASAGRSRSRISKRELVNMTSQMAIMMRAGVDIASALESLTRQCKAPELKAVLNEVHQGVLGGNSVSESMSHYPRVFDQTYVASMSAGEASGRLPEVLHQLADLLRSELRLKNSIRTMLAYPLMLSGVSSIVLLALVLFVLPKFAEIFADFESPLPIITQVLISISSELRTRWWLWVPTFAGLGAVAYTSTRSRTGRLLWDRISLNAPVVRDVTRTLLIGRICKLLGIMIDSGVPLLDSLRLVKSSVKNTLYGDLFDQLEDDVLNGRGLATALLDSEFVPAAASEMVMTAEKTGTLGMVTQMIGTHFEEEGETKLKEFVAYLEPAITVVMGALVGIIVMSVMLPLFEMSSAVKG